MGECGSAFCETNDLTAKRIVSFGCSIVEISVGEVQHG